MHFLQNHGCRLSNWQWLGTFYGWGIVRLGKAWLKWQGIAKPPLNNLMSTKASFASILVQEFIQIWQSDLKRAMSYGSCVFPFGGSSLGHTGSWNRWWEFGTCQAPDRFLEFTDSNSMRNPMEVIFEGLAYRMGPMPNESKPPMLYQISECV